MLDGPLRLLATILILTGACAAQETGVEQAPAARTRPADGAGNTDAPLRIGMLPRGEVGAFLDAMEPLKDGIAAAVGRPVEILPVASLSALIDAQVLRRVDAGFYSATAYASAEALCRCLEPLVAPAAGDGTTAYHGLVVARAGSGITGLSDLEGRRVVGGPADSVGSRHVQLAGLKEEGIDPQSFFTELINAESSVAAVRMMLNGRADAAFAWSSLAGAAEQGYSRGTLSWLVGRGELAMDDVSIVWRSRPITHGPFAVLKALPQHEKAALEAYLVGLADSDPAVYDRLELLYGGGFQPVEPADYRAVAAIVSAGEER